MATEHELKLLLAECYYALNQAAGAAHEIIEAIDNGNQEGEATPHKEDADMYFKLSEKIFKHM